MADSTLTNKLNWEKEVLQKLLFETLKEQRRSRRWSLFFKLAFLIYVIFALVAIRSDWSQPAVTTKDEHVALIDIHGPIMKGTESDADAVIESLDAVSGNNLVKGIVLHIDSPGGSPVQARRIFKRVMAHRKKHPEIKVYAVIDDMGASAAYLIASAADHIYCDETSLVGSIGVRLDSFGFVDAMEKVGVERRLYTAGENKGMLDPFLPKQSKQDEFVNEQLKTTHQLFIDNVKEGRGTRLVQDKPEIFSGLFWVGLEAKKLGLVDGFGDAAFVAKELIHNEILIDYTSRTSWLDKLTQNMSSAAMKGLLQLLQNEPARLQY